MSFSFTVTPLNSLAEWQNLLAESEHTLIVILKHSNTCPISAGAYERIEAGLKDATLSEPIYLVIVQEQRDVSDQIAEDLGVKHESPQILVVKNGKALYHASHRNITAEDLAQQL